MSGRFVVFDDGLVACGRGADPPDGVEKTSSVVMGVAEAVSTTRGLPVRSLAMRNDSLVKGACGYCAKSDKGGRLEKYRPFDRRPSVLVKRTDSAIGVGDVVGEMHT